MAGFSKSRLERVRGVLDGHVQRGAAPGVVAVLSRGGETLVEAAGDVRPDSIFRIASMTKPDRGGGGADSGGRVRAPT